MTTAGVSPTHWMASTDDPMDPAAIQARSQHLGRTRRAPVASRVEYLRDLARDKRVLDIGVVDHSSDTDRRDNWLHGALAGTASELLGVDIVAGEIERLKDQGYNVECMDVTAGELPPGQWDLIVAGELLEHLSSPGGLFDAAAKLLAPAGTLVLTTPNPYALWRVAQNLSDRTSENLDHALLINPWGMTELADRAGLGLLSFRGIGPNPVGWKAQLAYKASGLGLVKMTPEAFCESILYEVGHNSADPAFS